MCPPLSPQLGVLSVPWLPWIPVYHGVRSPRWRVQTLEGVGLPCPDFPSAVHPSNPAVSERTPLPTNPYRPWRGLQAGGVVTPSPARQTEVCTTLWNYSDFAETPVIVPAVYKGLKKVSQMHICGSCFFFVKSNATCHCKPLYIYKAGTFIHQEFLLQPQDTER